MSKPTSHSLPKPFPAEAARGPIAWMARHGVAPNLLMALLLIGGFMVALTIKKEFLPGFTADVVEVRLVYPGATPAEMEQAVVLPVENGLSSLTGIAAVNVSVLEGYASFGIEVEGGEDVQQVYQNILQEVNRISTFPAEVEQPIVAIAARQHDILDFSLHGDLDLFAMKRLAERIKDKVLETPHVTQVDIKGVPDEEVHIEINKLTLEKYGLTLQQVADVISLNAVEKSAGSMRTENGDVLVTLNDRRYWAEDYASIPLISDANGVQLTLGEVASVREGFEDTNKVTTLDGENSVAFSVFRAGDQTPTEVVDAIYEIWPQLEAMLPPGVYLTVIDDDAQAYRERLGLMLKNAFIGLMLVYILLSIFLEYRLAFWVTMGIPTSFLGAMLFLPVADVSINMISMFAFIISLGIVVDDAIIAGENIYQRLAEGHSRTEAAILGARDVAVPLSFAILTNIVAFIPLLSIPGGIGQAMMVIPTVVISCFIISWIEALYILPAHIAHMKNRPASRLGQKLDRIQARVDRGLNAFIHNIYRPFLSRTLRQPGLVILGATTVMVVVMSYPMAGHMGFSMFPKLEGEYAIAEAELPENASLEAAIQVRDAMEAALTRAVKPIEAKEGKLVVSVESEIDGSSIEIKARLVNGEDRPYTTNEVVIMWRDELGDLSGVRSMTFDAERGAGPVSGKAFTLELRSSETQVLRDASADLENILNSLSGVTDVANSFTSGKRQWDVELNENGRSLGLNALDVASQVRASLYGTTALKQQRGKNEVSVLVRLPKEERLYEADLARVMIVTPEGGRVPLVEVAHLVEGKAPAKIIRRDGRRVVTIGAEVEPRSLIPGLKSVLDDEYLPQLRQKYPGLGLEYRGRQADEQESMSSLLVGLAFTLMGIYILLAIPFKSYTQPVLVMAVIPFGIAGAMIGLIFFSDGLSIIAIMGMLALCGVVVNDSLILVVYANERREQGASIVQAILDAGERRFRPILLTTITTFGGLAPMVFETSRQAKFITPMAVALGFGILFTTLVCLLVLPSLYVLLERLKQRLTQSQEQPPLLATKEVVTD